ncbi:hypothetical protein T4B_14213 [Trichinella pseudospiralis]|uniref:Uncharacterized protein n=1 Tax=Trichinella pseudospiralis TaxID=6337 RepID=A0A0V1GU51_TRIPS|nr:hypothetical protein T4B_14213 [Trichinella pseudospiralis]
MCIYITTTQSLEIVKVMDLLEIITKYESIKELDAENECWYNVKEKWCVVLKTNDDLFLAASQLQSEALGFKYIHHHPIECDREARKFNALTFILNSKPIAIAVRSAHGLTSFISRHFTQSNEIEKRLGSMRSRDGIPTCFLRKI